MAEYTSLLSVLYVALLLQSTLLQWLASEPCDLHVPPTGAIVHHDAEGSGYKLSVLVQSAHVV